MHEEQETDEQGYPRLERLGGLSFPEYCARKWAEEDWQQWKAKAKEEFKLKLKVVAVLLLS